MRSELKHAPTDRAALRAELESWQAAWQAIGASFDPIAPDAEPAARMHVGDSAGASFVDDFGTLAARLVDAVGRERFPADFGDPPDLPGLPYDPGKLPAVFFGVSSIREAGQRAILWAAAAHDPWRFERSMGYPAMVRRWAGGLVLRTPENPERWRTIGQVPRWAVAAFDHAASGGNETQRGATHSPDFASVNWFGAEYVFTPNQRAIVAALWAALERGTPGVGGDALLESAEVSSDKVSHVFRNNPAWGTMIVSAGKGIYRLREPAGETFSLDSDDSPVAHP